MASLTPGISKIEYPLDSLDTRSCVSVCRSLGAEITELRRANSSCPNPMDENGEKLVQWIVHGRGPVSIPDSPKQDLRVRPPCAAKPVSPLSPGCSDVTSWDVTFCNAGNSGTTLFLGLAAASLGTHPVQFDGDEQLRSRSAALLLEALEGLGVQVSSDSGCAPIIVRGPWKGGRVSLLCPTSQYLSALLLAAPLAPKGVTTEIDITLLNEGPYIEMTLSYLEALKIPYKTNKDFSYFYISGGAQYKPLDGPIPADFSSAAFPAAAAAISGGSLTLLGLDPEDTQGDKEFFNMIKKMGCEVNWDQVPLEHILLGPFVPDTLKAIGQKPLELEIAEWRLTVSRKGSLKGNVFDLNAAPDLLPVMAIMASYAHGDTALVNVAHARIKETDRISAMAQELKKLGVQTRELPDGLIIHGQGSLNGGKVSGRGDHRIVMALAAGAMAAKGTLEISDAQAAAVSYPGFLELLGANVV